MSGETSLQKLLASMAPELIETRFVFCSFESAEYGDLAELAPIASFREQEGLTLVLPRENADKHRLEYQQVFCCITLQVHSSLDAIGLTAAISSRLTEHQISANVIAGYFHDHIFVPKDQAEKALEALRSLCQQ